MGAAPTRPPAMHVQSFNHALSHYPFIPLDRSDEYIANGSTRMVRRTHDAHREAWAPMLEAFDVIACGYLGRRAWAGGVGWRPTPHQTSLQLSPSKGMIDNISIVQTPPRLCTNKKRHRGRKTAFLRRSFATRWLKVPKSLVDKIKCKGF